jgi:Major Facilitator Superfamily
LPLLLVGCALLGGGNAAVMLARYAAADLASRRGRAISRVVAAASVGAVIGPNLLGPAGTPALTLGLPQPAGLFLLAIPAFLAAALVLLVFMRPDPLLVARATAMAGGAVADTEQPGPVAGKSDLAAVLGDRRIRSAVLVLALTNLTMVGVMALAPVHLHDDGAGMGTIGMVISAHIAAMYLPSPVTGWLADTLGGRTVAGVGALLLLGAGGAAAMAGSARLGVMAALLLLGVGWNAGLIAGSALLRDAPVQASLRTRAEAIGELGMGAAAAVGSGGAGLLLAAGGFGLLGVVAAAPCLLVLAVVVITDRPAPMGRRDGGRRPGSAAATTGTSPAFEQRGSR